MEEGRSVMEDTLTPVLVRFHMFREDQGGKEFFL